MSSRAIKKLLTDNGFEVFSVRKQKRSVGWTRYNFHSKKVVQRCLGGTSVYFYAIDLMQGTDEDKDLAVMILNDNGYKAKFGWYVGFYGLTVQTIKGLRCLRRSRNRKIKGDSLCGAKGCT